MEISSGIHRIEAPLGDRYVALYLVVGEDATLLVDTGLAESIQGTLVPYLDQIKHPISSIRYVVNTHSDFDHMGGNAALREINPEAVFMCGELDRALIDDLERMITDRYGEFQPEHGFDETPETKDFIRSVAHSTPIDVGLTGGERIQLGGRTVDVLHTPGHSPGHLSIWDETTGAVMIGDAVLGSSVLTADGNPAFPPTYRSVDEYRATINDLKARRSPLMLTAHYPVYTGPDVDEFLDHSLNYAAAIEELIFDTLAAAGQPVSLLDLIRGARGSFGSWEAGPADYLVYPVLGHLEVLEAAGRITRSAAHGDHVTWSVA